MRLLFALALASLTLPALAQNQPAPGTQGAYSVPVSGATGGYDFRFTPQPGARCPEWLSKTIAVDLKQTPCPEAVEAVLRLGGVSSMIEASSRVPVQLQAAYANERQRRANATALNTRKVGLTRSMTVEEALQEIARQAQVDIEFYQLPSKMWRVVIAETNPSTGNNLYITGEPQQTIVSGEIKKALNRAQQAQMDAAEPNRGGGRGGFGGVGGRGGAAGPGGFGGGGGAAPPARSARSLEDPVTIISQVPLGNNNGSTRLPAPGISEKLVSLDMRKKSLKECFETLLKPTRLDYDLEGAFPAGPPRTFVFEDLPLDLALDVLCANGQVGWSAELRNGKPFIKIGKRYAAPKQP